MPTLEPGKSMLAVVTQVFLSGLEVGGGPIIPDGPTAPEGAHPAHPIYFPDAHPDHTLPGDLPHPAHPIVIPPGDGIPPEVGEAPDKFDMKVGWTEDTGWVVVFVPNEGTLVPTPAK